jgi:hypothetical protein
VKAITNAAINAAIQAFLERWLGPAGVVGVALLVGCGAFYYAGVRPAAAERTALRAELKRMEIAKPLATAPGGAGEEALAGFYGTLGARQEVAAALRFIFDAAAAEGVATELGEYRVAPEAGSRLVRYQIVLPVKGSYKSVRRFVVRALNEVPGLALEGLDMRRESVAADTIEARIQLALYVVNG